MIGPFRPMRSRLSLVERRSSDSTGTEENPRESPRRADGSSGSTSAASWTFRNVRSAPIHPACGGSRPPAGWEPSGSPRSAARRVAAAVASPTARSPRGLVARMGVGPVPGQHARQPVGLHRRRAHRLDLGRPRSPGPADRGGARQQQRSDQRRPPDRPTTRNHEIEPPNQAAPAGRRRRPYAGLAHESRSNWTSPRQPGQATATSPRSAPPARRDSRWIDSIAKPADDVDVSEARDLAALGTSRGSASSIGGGFCDD